MHMISIQPRYRHRLRFFHAVFSLVFVTSLCSDTLFAQTWLPVWSDEFDGTEVDTTKWSFQIGDGCPELCGWGNAELEYYRAENASVAGGFLTITAKEESFGGADYTSARMRTKGKGDWTYGRFEMRAKMPLGRGFWPAFWLLSSDEVYGGWAASGEIDVMEYVGHRPDSVFGTIHYGAPSPGNVFTTNGFVLESGTFADSFHVFAVEWNPGVIRWFVDDSLYATVTDWYSTGAPFPAPFDQQFHLLLNLAVGGTLPGSPDETTVFPADYVIDYVKVFQADNLPPTVSIASPANDSTLPSGSDVTIEANAADADGTVMEVRFFQGDALIGEDSEAPFEITIPGVSDGCYALRAIAVDNFGGQAVSDTVNVQVGSCAQAPYLMHPETIPGVVHAENYDIGGQGIAYNDSDPDTNNGSDGENDYRPSEGVDLELTFDNGFGHAIGSIEAGEWVEYLVDVNETATYTVDVRVSADAAGGALHVEFDGTDKTGTIEVGSTGGDWATVRTEGVALEAGTQVMRLAIEAGGFRINNVTFTKEEGGGTKEASVFEDFEDGDASDWNFIGGGIGEVLTDRPAEGGSYFSTNWSGPGGGFYGGFWKNTPNDMQVPVPDDPWLNVWVYHESAGTTVDEYRLEITVREDTDGNGWTSGQEDSRRLDVVFRGEDFNDRWTLVSAPISDFLDLGGGNGIFETAVDEIFIGIAQVSGASGATVAVDFDYVVLTSGGPLPIEVFEDFEDGDASDWSFIGGGSGEVLTDRPGEGNSYFSTSWSGPGGGFYGGFWKNTPNDMQLPVPEDPWLNVLVYHESAGTTVDTYRLELTVREDTDGNGWTSGQEDSRRLDVEFAATDFNDQWTLVSAPISDFLDLGGGNGIFEVALDEIFVGIAQVSGPSGATVEVDFDYIALSSGGPLPSPTPTANDDPNAQLPGSFGLNEVYPNPFVTDATITYDLPRSSRVRLDVFDVLGRRIRTVVDQTQPGGRYDIRIDGRDLAAGVYLFRLTADRFVQVRSATRLR